MQGLMNPPKWLHIHVYGWNSTVTYSKLCKGSIIVVDHFIVLSIKILLFFVSALQILSS